MSDNVTYVFGGKCFGADFELRTASGRKMRLARIIVKNGCHIEIWGKGRFLLTCRDPIAGAQVLAGVLKELNVPDTCPALNLVRVEMHKVELPCCVALEKLDFPDMGGSAVKEQTSSGSFFKVTAPTMDILQQIVRFLQDETALKARLRHQRQLGAHRREPSPAHEQRCAKCRRG